LDHTVVHHGRIAVHLRRHATGVGGSWVVGGVNIVAWGLDVAGKVVALVSELASYVGNFVLELRIAGTRRLERRGVTVDVAVDTVGIEVDVFHVLRARYVVFNNNTILRRVTAGTLSNKRIWRYWASSNIVAIPNGANHFGWVKKSIGSNFVSPRGIYLASSNS